MTYIDVRSCKKERKKPRVKALSYWKVMIGEDLLFESWSFVSSALDYQGWVYCLFIVCSEAAQFISLLSVYSFGTPIIPLLIWVLTLILITVGGVFWPGPIGCSQCPIHGLHWKPWAGLPRLKVGRIPYQLLIFALFLWSKAIRLLQFISKWSQAF